MVCFSVQLITDGFSIEMVLIIDNYVWQVTSEYIRNTLINSSMTITNLIGPVEQMSLSDHPIKGLYFFVVNAPQVYMHFNFDIYELIWTY